MTLVKRRAWSNSGGVGCGSETNTNTVGQNDHHHRHRRGNDDVHVGGHDNRRRSPDGIDAMRYDNPTATATAWETARRGRRRRRGDGGGGGGEEEEEDVVGLTSTAVHLEVLTESGQSRSRRRRSRRSSMTTTTPMRRGKVMTTTTTRKRLREGPVKSSEEEEERRWGKQPGRRWSTRGCPRIITYSDGSTVINCGDDSFAAEDKSRHRRDRDHDHDHDHRRGIRRKRVFAGESSIGDCI